MYLGIDLGTSSVKIILVDSTGVIHKTVSKKIDSIIPQPSWSEQDPNTWYQQTIRGLQEIVVGYEDNIQAIGFSGQMHGLVLLDKEDRVLRNALLWNDQRTVAEVEYLNNNISFANLLKYTGNIALTGLTAPKLLWVHNNEPEIFAKIDKILLPKDFLVFKLSGSFSSDVSDLSGTLYFDPNTRDYSQDMLDILSIKREMLPDVHESYEVVGTLRKEIKELLHIKQDVNIIIGGGDQAVGAIGVGVVNDGDCNISLGTSGVIFVSSDTFNVDTKSYLQSYAHANGKYHIMAVMLNAAGAIKWWNESIFNNDDYDTYYSSVQQAKKLDNLFFLPYLTGERAPINDPFAKGVLYGLGVHHTKSDLDYAVVEGVTFALRDSFELIKNLGVPIEHVHITGGGAKSTFWAQLIADIMGVTVTKIKAEEGPAYGAVILAMVGNGEYNTVQEACKHLVQFGDVFTPSEEKHSFYNQKYNQFTKLYSVIHPLFREIK